MAYDRHDTRRERERGRHWDSDRGSREDRGFFERAGDEIASWFGDDEPERRRRDEERMSPDHRERESGRERYAIGGWGERDRDRDFDRRRYAYGRGERSFGQRSRFDRGDFDRSDSPWGRDDYRRTSFAGSGREHDRHFSDWRQRQLEELDRDYDEYQRERQQRFEEDFGSWRQQRQQKRAMLPKIREHMEVVGSDGETIGKVDRVLRDRIILTRSDADDNRHHSLGCAMIDTVEDDKVRLDVPAEEAKSRLRDEERGGFFRRDEEEDVNLERSFSGTYS